MNLHLRLSYSSNLTISASPCNNYCPENAERFDEGAAVTQMYTSGVSQLCTSSLPYLHLSLFASGVTPNTRV